MASISCGKAGGGVQPNVRNLYRFYQKKHRGECGNLDCDGYPPPADLSSGWTAVSGLCAEQRIC